MNEVNINTVLIANRGEIASRVIRTCKKMGIRTIAIYSEVDKDMPYVSEASTSVNVGGPALATSYLDQDLIISIAQMHGADAIHPGYGFLSENAGFAQRCKSEGIIFIGPNAKAIEAMGSKSQAKTLMLEHGVPTIPGYQGEDQSEERLKKEAVAMGFPVLLKAAAGGGGKGMRIVHEEKELDTAIAGAKREGKSAFGDDELIIEKYIAKGRHIEFQIFGDQHGHVIHILERECSIQRRYQKVVEESPSPVMTKELRQQMGSSAVAAAAALNYDNAGTVEFIYDDTTGDYYFLEVNTRLQVEHPVTEEITGLDLVQMQIESAQGLPLQVTQEDIKGSGYAIEVRLYAEDPANDFLPVSGKIINWQVPEVDGLRVETAINTGSEISIFYDPMIAKLIMWARDRTSAMRKMHYVLQNLVCHGITTNQDFLIHLLSQDLFQQGQYDTHYIANHIKLDEITKDIAPVFLIAAAVYEWAERKETRTLLSGLPTGWRNNFTYPQSITYLHGEEEYEVRYRDLDGILEVKVTSVGDDHSLDTNKEKAFGGVSEEVAPTELPKAEDRFIDLRRGTKGEDSTQVKPKGEYSSNRIVPSTYHTIPLRRGTKAKESIQVKPKKEDAPFKHQYSSFPLQINHTRHNFTISKEADKIIIQNETFGSVTLTTKERFPLLGNEAEEGAYITPMPSQIIKVLVAPGDEITTGQELVVLSSMKMENTVTAFEEGVVEEVYVADGDSVEAGVVLLKMS